MTEPLDSKTVEWAAEQAETVAATFRNLAKNLSGDHWTITANVFETHASELRRMGRASIERTQSK